MPILAEVGRKSWKIRLLVAAMYLVLTILGVTMVYPFLMTLTASTTNAMDYERYLPYSRSLFSREERFVRGTVRYFPERMRNGMDLFSLSFNEVPETWSTWKSVGEDYEGITTFAQRYLSIADDPEKFEKARRIAKDYNDFAMQYPIEDSMCSFSERNVGPFLRDQYRDLAQKEAEKTGARLFGGQAEMEALRLLSEKWGVPYENFYVIKTDQEFQTPWDQYSYIPRTDGRAQDFDNVREAYRNRYFLPAIIKSKWGKLLRSAEAREALGLKGKGPLTVAELNSVAGASYGSFRDVPYPITADQPEALQKLWLKFTGEVFPVSETRPFPMKIAWFKYLGSAPRAKSSASKAAVC